MMEPQMHGTLSPPCLLLSIPSHVRRAAQVERSHHACAALTGGSVLAQWQPTSWAASLLKGEDGGAMGASHKGAGRKLVGGRALGGQSSLQRVGKGMGPKEAVSADMHISMSIAMGSKRSAKQAGVRLAFPHIAKQPAMRPAVETFSRAPAQPVTTVPARIALEEDMADRVQRAGLGGALGVDAEDLWQGGGVQGRAVVAQLREEHRRRILATWNLARIGAALGWWEEFLAATGRVPFRALTHAGDLPASIYNNTTLDLFMNYMRGRGSRKAGKQGEQLSSDYIGATTSTIRLLRNGEAHYDVAPKGENTARPALLKGMRVEDGPLAARRAGQGFRAMDFRAIADTYDRKSRVGVMEWSVAHASHSMLLRPGEVGHMQRKVFDAARGISIASLLVRTPCADSLYLPWITIDVVAIKDTQARHRPVPMPIRQLEQAGDVCEDPMCAHTAIMAQYRLRCIEVPACIGPCEWCKRGEGEPRPRGRPPAECARANAPLFADASGRALDVKTVKAIGKKMATAAGVDPGTVAGRLWRVGGATDLRDTLGMAGAAMIKERGRWASDVAFVYARALIGQQMSAAAGMVEASRKEVERVVKGWVQPAKLR